MVAGMLIGSCVSFFLGLCTPASGPDWMWAGGRNDVLRNLYFRPDGSFRRFGRLGLHATLFAGSAAVYWMTQRL